MALAAEHLAALGAGLLERADHVAVSRLVDQRSDQGAVGDRVADRQLPVGRHDPLDERVGHRPVHDQPAQRGAPLAGGARGGEHDAAHGEVEIRRRRDDRGVVAAELQQRLAEPLRHPRTDLLTHPHRAGRAHQRDPRVIDQPFADLAPALDQPVEARGAPTSSAARSVSAWQASAVSGVSSEGFHTRVSPQTSAIAAFHDHTATGKLNAVITPTTPSGCQVSISRCPGRSEAMVLPYSCRDSPTANSQMSIISWTSPRASEVIFPASTVTSAAEIVLVLVEQLAEPGHQRATHRRRRGAPRGKRLRRFGNRGVGLFGRGLRDGEQYVARDGVLACTRVPRAHPGRHASR